MWTVVNINLALRDHRYTSIFIIIIYRGYPVGQTKTTQWGCNAEICSLWQEQLLPTELFFPTEIIRYSVGAPSQLHPLDMQLTYSLLMHFCWLHQTVTSSVHRGVSSRRVESQHLQHSAKNMVEWVTALRGVQVSWSVVHKRGQTRSSTCGLSRTYSNVDSGLDCNGQEGLSKPHLCSWDLDTDQPREWDHRYCTSARN